MGLFGKKKAAETANYTGAGKSMLVEGEPEQPPPATYACEYTGLQPEEAVAREEAATKIQAAIRGKAGRNKAELVKSSSKYKDEEYSEEQDAAAAKIQAARRQQQIRRQDSKASRAQDDVADTAEEVEEVEVAIGVPNKVLPVSDFNELEFAEALKRAQEGDCSFVVLSALSKKRDEMLSELDGAVLEELIGGNDPQTNQKRPRSSYELRRDAKKSNSKRELRHNFLQFCRDRRGSGLRAWRLDLDLRGINRVTYSDFTGNAQHMGLSQEEAMLVWQAWRPPEKLSEPLCFHEFDPAEWANLNVFLEVLWNDFNFDIDLVWSYFDKDGNGFVDVKEFEAGTESIGFNGHPQRIFYGLDSSGNGRMWKETMYYLFMLQPESHVKPQDSPLIREFQVWVRKNFESASVLCEKLGLKGPGSSASIHSTARKLQQLGFKGNSLHTAIALSRCNQFVSRSDVIQAMGGRQGAGLTTRRTSKSYAGRAMLLNGHEKDGIAHGNMCRKSQKEKPEWNNGVYDPCKFNEVLGSRERHVFSLPFCRPVKEEVLSRLSKPEDDSPNGKSRKPGLSQTMG